MQRRLEEAAWRDLDRDDHPIAQMFRRRFIEAMIQRRLQNGMSLDTEPIVSYRQEEAHRGGGFGGVPASAAAMAGLDKQTFRATAGGGGGGGDCAICLEGFDDGEEVSVMPCSHRHGFHPVCITKWLIRSNMCPVCLPPSTAHGC
ncbi:hypothetical protein HU200_030829 [Digitaria exilis]|uniref:RING-type domain-containing protein n=1 Tax=Digitaria exilis TaxID=1010633 RepID=A0A835BSB5_9POAL|nr:hypothetical protein HU200_030829 [Digitaria exilis]